MSGADREERLKRQLRANLGRRKARARAAVQPGRTDDAPPPASHPSETDGESTAGKRSRPSDEPDEAR